MVFLFVMRIFFSLFGVVGAFLKEGIGDSKREVGGVSGIWYLDLGLFVRG